MDREEIENLIARVALKDRAAFELLYDRVSAKLFGVCLRVLSKRAAAEDAMQDTFVKIWNNADRYQTNGLSPMTWLITIARNTSIDRLRKRRKGHQDIDTPGLELAAPGPSPEQSAIAASEASQLIDCLDTLEADRAAAVRGAYLDGDTYADLAERFAVPLNTMRTWLRRGLLALRECMSQ
ncbi:MAG: RNA polymerase sigma-70 factor (ECF subfamily) [Sulfitobacter sp.]|jgi:RNA polymerase sigma-70 factor, ECF subfamily